MHVDSRPTVVGCVLFELKDDHLGICVFVLLYGDWVCTYRALVPTSVYGDIINAFFGSNAVVLVNVMAGLVFARILAVRPLIRFSKDATISNYAQDGRYYFQFKICGSFKLRKCWFAVSDCISQYSSGGLAIVV